MQRTCLWNTAGTTPFSKDITKEQPFMKVLLFLILTSSSPCTPSQSPTGTSGCIGLNNGLFVWRKFTGNIKLLLRQERLLYGSQDRRKSRSQMENCASSGQKCTCSLRCVKFHHRYQSPGEVQSSQLSWQHGDPWHLLSLKEKARLLWMDFSSKETVKNFVWSVIFVYLCTAFDMFMYLKRVYATFSFANLHHRENKTANNTWRSYARDVHCFSSSAWWGSSLYQ